jgi:elongation factor P
MISASELKKGTVVEIANAVHVVENVSAKSPSARGGTTLYKIRTRNLVTGQKADHSFKGDDNFKEPDCQKTEVEFSYVEGDKLVFMDLENYEQYEIEKDFIAEEVPYLKEGTVCIGLIIDGAFKGLTLPASVTLKVVECAPSMKSASATARTKPGTLETGLIVQLPEYLECGELIKVNTITGEFQSRAK